jgi:hypothetical protein
MFRKAAGYAIFQLLIAMVLNIGIVHAQQSTGDFDQKYAAEVSKARAECLRLWSNHIFDPFRTRINFGEEKPTFSMLKSTEKLSRKEIRVT